MKVLFTVPNGSGWIHKHVARLIPRLLSDNRYRVTYMDPTHRPYEHNLNRCAAEVLTGNYDFWLSVDDDNPPIGNPLDLVERDLPLVGFPTPVWHDEVQGDRPYYYNALDKSGDAWKPHEPCQGLQEVDAIGSGCFLMARRVLEAMPPPWFMREYDANGFVEKGHDYLFCEKMKQLGYRIHAYYDIPCQHFCEIELLTAIRSFNMMGALDG